MKEYKAYIDFTPVPDHSSRRILWAWTARVYSSPNATMVLHRLEGDRLFTTKEEASVIAKLIATAYTKAHNEDNFEEFTIEVD